ncbi:MAG: excinuclease ABC subunit UvrC [Bacteroidetes bacterium]|nr:excinuclease ABC subunit UvrC [Bacteroidota bacterium]MCL5026663.1 excinuclease ABC subunit UvrC [Chloroflexota bacterium]
MATEELKQRLGNIPAKPGVYIFKDEHGDVLYVGKSARLRSRVRSYFRERGLSSKTQLLMEKVADFELFFTDSEVEALILECNLIKDMRPRYNIRLRDDKHYPYLRVSMDEEWPRIHVARRINQDGARYFGPYTDSKSVWQTLEVLSRIFPYRTCRKPITGADRRPCLNYHIGRCLAPCTGAVTREEYLAVIEQMCLFLDGKSEQITRELRAKMDAASRELNFEQAAFYRDRVQAIEKVTERQKVISKRLTDEDVVAFAQDEGQACVQVFFVRGGKLLGKEHFILDNTEGEDPRQVISSFVTQFYVGAAYIPPRIILQHEVMDPAVVQSWLGERRGGKVALKVARRGEKRQLVELAEQNAVEVLREMKLRRMSDEGKMAAAVQELGDNLGLEAPPWRIECYDISNIQGTSAVGSMVVFERGRPKTSDYRRFRIKTVAGADDYAMLQEVFRRRFKRAASHLGQSAATDGGDARPAKDNATNWGVLPDLVLVDGGKGQLNAVLEVMEDTGFANLAVAGLAKEREELFMPRASEPLLLPRGSQSLFLVQRIRDEAHRFALAYHQQLRARRTLASPLDEVPGIGPRRKSRLLKRFGSLSGIRDASIEDLASTVGMTRTLAERLKQYL